MKLILIRHGESIANKNKKHQGRDDEWRDTSLSEKGMKQTKKVSERLKNEQIDYIFSSDLKRAKETAKEINKNHNKKISLDKRLGEKQDEEEIEEIISRLKEFLNEIKKLQGNILIVAHGYIKQFLLAILTKSRKKGGEIIKKERMKNTSVSIVEKQGEHYEIKIIDCIKHLIPDKEMIKIFEKVQKIPYKIKQYIEEEIDENLKEGDCRHKSKLLIQLLKKEGYESAKGLRVIFDWKDLPIPKKILEILQKSSTKQVHFAVRVKAHGNYLYLDPTWPISFEKMGFPVTKNWGGLEDTKQVTEGELEFFKKYYFEGERDEILKQYNITQDGEERDKFAKELNDWLKEKTSNL